MHGRLSFSALISVLVISTQLSACVELKDAGRTIGHTSRDVAKDIGHASRDVAKNVGRGAKRVFSETTSNEDESG